MHERIAIDPKICDGKPVIKGTRVPMAIVVGSPASFKFSTSAGHPLRA